MLPVSSEFVLIFVSLNSFNICWDVLLKFLSSNSVAEKYWPNSRPIYWSFKLGQIPSKNPMCPPLAVITIATWDEFDAASIGIAVIEQKHFYFISEITLYITVPSNGWNGSSAALRHRIGVVILCNLSCNVAVL